MEGRGVEAQKIRTLYRGFGVAVTIKGLLGDVQVVKDSVESKVSRPFVLMEIVPTCHFGATKQSTPLPFTGPAHLCVELPERPCTPRYFSAWRFMAADAAIFYQSLGKLLGKLYTKICIVTARSGALRYGTSYRRDMA